MYIPRLRRLNDVLREIKQVDKNTPITYNLLRHLMRNNDITYMFYGNSMAINLDELYSFFHGGKSQRGRKETLTKYKITSKFITSGRIAEIYKTEDAGTIIRYPNARRYVIENKIRHIFTSNVILFDGAAFIRKTNPKKLKEHFYTVPIIRNIRSVIKEFNDKHKHIKGWKIHPYEVHFALKDKSVFRYLHGNKLLINYTQIEKVLIDIKKERLFFKSRNLK